MKKRVLILALASMLLFACNDDVNSSNNSSIANSSLGESSSSVASSFEKESSNTSQSLNETTGKSSNSSEANTSSKDTSSSKNPVETESSVKPTTSSTSEKEEQKETTVYLIGEQIAAKVDMKETSSNYKYYYPSKGFGETLSDYFNDKVTFNNLSANQGSINSLTFPTDSKTKTGYENYQKNLKEGDFVLISFGINDRKIDGDSKPGIALGNDEGKFQYNLKKYVNEAKNKGATPILLTPYVSYDSNKKYAEDSKYLYNKQETKAHEGNYPKAIRDVATELSVLCIDNTTWTADLFRSEAITNDDVQKWYCWKDSAENGKNMTNTFNAYGAQKVGYHIADVLKNSDNGLGKYIKDNITDPTMDEYLKVNENYQKS